MAGFHNTPTTSEFHRHSSWGRTRTPKGLSDGSIRTNGRTATQVTTIAAGAAHDALDSTAAGENGYSTENQRFLHILIENNDALETLTLYSYNYAFGKWAQLFIPAAGNQATAQLTYVAAQWASIDGKKQIVVPIEGIDRIAFIDDGTHDGSFKVFAACSTF